MCKFFQYFFLILFFLFNCVNASEPVSVCSLSLPGGVVKVDDGQMHYFYIKNKKTTLRPLVVIIGLSSFACDWPKQFITALASKRSVYLLDYPGIYVDYPRNRAGLTNEHFTFYTLSNDIKQFLQKMKLKRVDLLGWSLGTMTIYKFAEYHPRYVGQLYLLASRPGGGTDAKDIYTEERATAAALMKKITVCHSVKQCNQLEGQLVYSLFPKTVCQRSKICQNVSQLFVENRKHYQKRHHRQFAVPRIVLKQQLVLAKQWNRRKHGICQKNKRGITCANFNKTGVLMTLFHGKQDYFMNYLNALTVAQHVNTANVIVFNNAGHGLVYQHPIVVAELVNKI